MKIRTRLVMSLLILAAAGSAAAQETPAPQHPDAGPPARLSESGNLTRFNLDFAGGTPNELVAAIEQAMGRPLNAIVPNEHANVALPPLKMNNVDVAQLFHALGRASQRMMWARNRHYEVSFGFQTHGRPSDDSVWYFFHSQPEAPLEPISRFYLLTPYLDQGLTVDDITTAIQTGWKMLGQSTTPVLSFHQETKLLIAVGEPHQLQTIDQVLNALRPAPPPGENQATAATISGQKPNE